MRITFHGAARSVTGSQHLLEINGNKILLDCGLYQGAREEAYKINQSFAYNPEEVDAVILSHSHIDHSGNLPNLVKHGFEGPIYTSLLSAHLTSLMLSDSAHIQEMEAEDTNIRSGRKNGNIRPLYTQQDAEQVSKLLEPLPYNREFEPVKGVTARLVEAGHIMGSASVVLDVEEPGREPYRVWFSGDIGRPRLPLVRDPILPFNAHYLILESTYGDTIHPDPGQAYEELSKVIARTVERGGKVIVPSFAVGRTQDLVFSLNMMMEDGKVPRVPLIIDSPLAVNASEIIRQHPEFFDKETYEFVQSSGNSALNFDELEYITSASDSRAINDRGEPLIILSASGMADNGRIQHHLAQHLGDPRSTVMLVSYQAPHTLGRQLEEGCDVVEIFGKQFQRKAEVAVIKGFSAHAGQDFLLEYALASKNTLEGLYLVQGEEQTQEKLRDKMHAAGLERVSIPYLRQSISTD